MVTVLFATATRLWRPFRPGRSRCWRRRLHRHGVLARADGGGDTSFTAYHHRNAYFRPPRARILPSVRAKAKFCALPRSKGARDAAAKAGLTPASAARVAAAYASDRGRPDTGRDVGASSKSRLASLGAERCRVTIRRATDISMASSAPWRPLKPVAAGRHAGSGGRQCGVEISDRSRSALTPVKRRCW